MDCNNSFVNHTKLYAQKDDEGRRLDRILRKALPGIPLSAIHRILRKGSVLVNGVPGKGEDRIPAGAVILLPVIAPQARGNMAKTGHKKTALPGQAKPGIDILWEGGGLLILNKPPGEAVHGGGGQQDNLDSRVQGHLAGKLPPSLSFKPGPLHRLDKPTSGIVAFALNLEAAKIFSALLRERKVTKRYLAILEGVVKKSETWEEMLARDKKTKKTLVSRTQAATAITVVTPLAHAKKEGRPYTLARLEIITGRTHQIRAQAAYHGYPLAGDRKYGGREFSAGRGFFLHAAELELPREPDIFPAVPRVIKAPLPENFSQTAKMLFNVTI
jgi:23S rRNA pseudouridine955/2504/2580 synthase